MNIRVFYKIAENLSGPRISTETLRDTKSELLALKEELGKLLVSKDEPKKEKLENIKRRIARLERFDALENNAGNEQKDITEILKWKTADTIKNSDILTLRKKWVDIANLTLVDNANPEREIRSSEIKEKDTFTVNFGNNTSLRDRTGAGDILPPNIRKISINGVDCERKNTPRPGYYNHKWKYEPIYDGYKIEIVALWETTEADTAGNEKQWKRERLKDIEDNNWEALTSISEDATLVTDYKDIQKQRQIKRERYSTYNPENKEKFVAIFWDILERETSRYWIPKNILVDNLFAKENARFDPNLKNPYSSALGFWQIINSTWRFIESSILFEDLDRYDPEDQIKATCAYLNYIKELKWCSWWDAVVYYHTWPGFGNSNVQTAMSVNPAIVAHMWNMDNPTARDYIEWAKKYYWIRDQA